MSASNGTNGYLVDWRNSFSLVRNNLYCRKGRTFRGAHPSVETDGFLPNSCIIQARADAGRGAGTAKPGPTTDTSSRIARLKKLQTRRRTRPGQQSNGGTDRGAHGSVQNGESTGAAGGFASASAGGGGRLSLRCALGCSIALLKGF